MIGLVTMSALFPGIRKNLKRWQMHGFPMSFYFAEMLTFIGWNQRKFAISQYGGQNFLDGV